MMDSHSGDKNAKPIKASYQMRDGILVLDIIEPLVGYVVTEKVGA